MKKLLLLLALLPFILAPTKTGFYRFDMEQQVEELSIKELRSGTTDVYDTVTSRVTSYVASPGGTGHGVQSWGDEHSEHFLGYTVRHMFENGHVAEASANTIVYYRENNDPANPVLWTSHARWITMNPRPDEVKFKNYTTRTGVSDVKLKRLQFNLITPVQK